MDVLTAVVLGIIQGATEWLPVSSSGHLAIAQYALGVRPPVLFDLLLHVGTLAAVLSFFWDDWKRAVMAFFRLLRASLGGKQSAIRSMKDEPMQRLALLLVIGTIPIAVLGYAFEGWIEKSFTNMLFVSIALLVTGVFLLPTGAYKGKRGIRDIEPKDGVMVGLAQAAALFPGISRSGFTISAGLYLGLERRFAARYSFLLSIPAILGATVYHAVKVASGAIEIESYMVIGMFVAAIVGYITIWPVLMAVRKSRFHFFSYYCFAIGLIVLLLYVLFS